MSVVKTNLFFFPKDFGEQGSRRKALIVERGGEEESSNDQKGNYERGQRHRHKETLPDSTPETSSKKAARSKSNRNRRRTEDPNLPNPPGEHKHRRNRSGSHNNHPNEYRHSDRHSRSRYPTRNQLFSDDSSIRDDKQRLSSVQTPQPPSPTNTTGRSTAYQPLLSPVPEVREAFPLPAPPSPTNTTGRSTAYQALLPPVPEVQEAFLLPAPPTRTSEYLHTPRNTVTDLICCGQHPNGALEGDTVEDP